MLKLHAVVLLVLVVAASASGCGNSAGRPTTRSVAALGYDARNPNGGQVARATPADFAEPIAAYRRHVHRQLTAMGRDARSLVLATGRRDLRAARAAWRLASSRYETIGAAYGAFGRLDAEINGRAAGLPGGVRSPAFTGLHRIEYALWRQRSTAAARPFAKRLVADVARLRARMPSLEIDPFEYSLRAHEVLEDTLHLQLSGAASPWSDTALDALRSNVAGTEVVLGSLRSMIAPRDAAGTLGATDRALARLRAEIMKLRRAGGAMPSWSTLPKLTRERVDGLTAAAAEQLAFIPEIVDPRPARPLQRATG